MKVLFAAAEAAPLVKVGGLADVIGSLPAALNKLGHDVRVMVPRYGEIDVSKFPVTTVLDSLSVPVMGTVKPASIEIIELANGVKVYLVNQDDFSNTTDIYDQGELERFFLFCRAVLEALPKLDWQPEIVHCHDWHTALIPMWLRRNNHHYASVFTIHNLAYQGAFSSEFLINFGLEQDWRSIRVGDQEPPLNFMSQGILCADKVTTVSETYAREILTPEYGERLDYLLRYRRDDLLGIVNGLDYKEFNPATDNLIPARYTVSKIDRKLTNKMALQARTGLVESVDIPIIGMVSRLDEQKGFDILVSSLDTLFERIEAQMVILGSGTEMYHDPLRQAAMRHPQKLAVFGDFDDRMAHLIYSGCDMFLMPSRFEPCGLGQLIAMRYGSVPIVRRTGGLAETVQNLSPDISEGTGFVFENFDSGDMLAAIQLAVDAYRNRRAWLALLQRIMALDFSWKKSAKKYLSLYRSALESNNG